MKNAIAIGAMSACLALPVGAQAQEYTLRIQSLFSEASLPGQTLLQFYDDINVMSGGRIVVEPFFSSAVVKSAETFDAVVNGILDGDTTQPSYQVGKDTAFQFVGDPMGGYDTPWQMYAWLYEGGGLEMARELYAQYDMFLVGWWVHGPESLSSSKQIASVADLENWKFRSPPGMETDIFANLGASPVVMDFTEIFTAMESGVIDGADASNLSINKSLGIYDVVEHATYPGFHSMPADHFAMRRSSGSPSRTTSAHHRGGLAEARLPRLALGCEVASRRRPTSWRPGDSTGRQDRRFARVERRVARPQAALSATAFAESACGTPYRARRDRAKNRRSMRFARRTS